MRQDSRDIFGGASVNGAASVKDRLKNRGRETGKTLQELLTVYGLERTIYRLSISRFKENFTLKGGILLYALFDGNFARATTDIDLLAQKISNGMEDIKAVFAEIFAIKAGDPLHFDIGTLAVKSIAEFKKYHGVNISIIAFLDRTQIPISIDIGFGDVIYPARVEMEFPVVLSDDPPRIYAYSLCSSIAEKFEAIVSLAYDNSRFKDFYDLYVLSTTHDFDRVEMYEAVKETFENRHTPITEIVAFEPGFADDPLRQSRWKAFVKKKKAMLPITLEDAIRTIHLFLGPIADAINKGENALGRWDHETQSWK